MSDFTRSSTTAIRLRQAMELREKKQIDLVNETGINRGTISRYLSGEYEPKQTAVNKLAKVLDVAEMWLWGYDCPMERPIDQKNNDTLADIVIRMRTDEEFFDAVNIMYSFDKEKFQGIKQMLTLLK